MFGRNLKKRYSQADLSRFTQTDWFGDTDAVYFKSKDGKQMTQVFDKTMSNQYYYTDEIKKALGYPVMPAMNIVPATNLFQFSSGVDFEFKPKIASSSSCRALAGH